MQLQPAVDHMRTGRNLELKSDIWGAKGDDRDDLEMRSVESRPAL